jgi:hypothetical protein
MKSKREMLDEYFARNEVNHGERESLERLFTRANPPPTLYRYRKPNDWTLEEIAKQHIYAATPDDLNDPFEYSAPLLYNRESFKKYFVESFAPTQGLSAEQAEREFDTSPFSAVPQRVASVIESLRRETGVICFTAIPNSIRMWSYYAEAHKGICIGFDTRMGAFVAAMKVAYQNPDKPLDLAEALRLDSTALADHISLRKAAEWEFEEEYRIPIGPIGDRPRAIPFPVEAITEIRFGARIQPEFRTKVIEAISRFPRRPRLIQMGCDFERFVLTEQIIDP